MEIRLGIFMKEKVLSQENQASLMDGLTSTKVVDFRQLYLETHSSKISEDHGMVICRKMVTLISELICPMKATKDSAGLWILLTRGPDTLATHRNPLRHETEY